MAVVLSACSVSASAPEATVEKAASSAEVMTEPEASMNVRATTDDEMSEDEGMTGDEMSEDEGMMDDEMLEDEGMMGDEMPTTEGMMDDEMLEDEGMISDEMSTTQAMMDEEDSEVEMMMEEEAIMAPAWYGVELTDVNSNAVFKVADFKGKVVLVETLAVWCSTCLRQQKEVQALHELLGERDDFISLGIDIDPNETPDILRTHTTRNGFDWLYAVAPVEVAREIGQLYGDQFLNPPSAPMLIIDRQGQVHSLPFGVKSARTLQEALVPFLN
jgi:hypothetical protein